MFGMISLIRKKVGFQLRLLGISDIYCSGAKIWTDTYGYDFASFIPSDHSGTKGNAENCFLNCLQAEYSKFAKRCRRTGGEFKCCMSG